MNLIKFENFNSIVNENNPEEVISIFKFVKKNISSLDTKKVSDRFVPYMSKLIDKIIENNYDLNYSELSTLYELHDILKKDLEIYEEIDDYFLEWIDSRRWGISRAVAPGCYIFHIRGGYKAYSDFFAEMDDLTKRKKFDTKITSMSYSDSNFLAMSIKVYKKENK